MWSKWGTGTCVSDQGRQAQQGIFDRHWGTQTIEDKFNRHRHFEIYKTQTDRHSDTQSNMLKWVPT